MTETTKKSGFSLYISCTVLLVFALAELLNVDGLHHLLAVGDRRLLESLTGTQFFDDTGLFGFTLEFLEGAFDVVAFLNGNNNHNVFALFFSCYVCKILNFFVVCGSLHKMGYRRRATGQAILNWVYMC